MIKWDYRKQIELACSDKNDPRVAMTGVLFNGSEFIATDSHVLSIQKLKVEDEGERKKRIIIPANVFKTIRGIIKNNKEEFISKVPYEINFHEVPLEIEEKEIRIYSAFDSTRLVSVVYFRPIMQNYPDYEAVLPTKESYKEVSQIKYDCSFITRLVKIHNCDKLLFKFCGHDKGTTVIDSSEEITSLLMPKRIEE